jgi:hypothetical protein
MLEAIIKLLAIIPAFFLLIFWQNIPFITPDSKGNITSKIAAKFMQPHLNINLRSVASV